MVGVTLDARPPNSHAQPGEPPEPPYECGDRGWGEETTNPEEPPATPDRTPQASSTRTSLAADRGRYDNAPCIGAGHSGPANPAPSARDVWLMKVGGRDLGARRNFGEEINFN